MAQNVLSCKLLDLGWLSQGKYDSQFAFLFYSFLSQLRVTVGDGVLRDLHPALTLQPLSLSENLPSPVEKRERSLCMFQNTVTQNVSLSCEFFKENISSSD